MIPGSVAGTALLLALVPGYVFSRRTEKLRRPAQQSALQELLQLVGFGLLTSGSTFGVVAVFFPGAVGDLVQADFSTDAKIRQAVALVVAVLAGAVVVSLAVARALTVTIPAQARIADGVMQEMLGESREGFVRHVSFELQDGRTFDGPLRSFTLYPDQDGGRQIAIRTPIRCTKPGRGKSIQLSWDSMSVDLAAVKFVAVKLVRESQRRGRG